MVVGRRRFTWRADVRGVAVVAALGVLTLLASAIVMGLVLLLGGSVLGGGADGGAG
jgi:hypothetical protein